MIDIHLFKHNKLWVAKATLNQKVVTVSNWDKDNCRTAMLGEIIERGCGKHALNWFEEKNSNSIVYYCAVSFLMGVLFEYIIHTFL